MQVSAAISAAIEVNNECLCRQKKETTATMKGDASTPVNHNMHSPCVIVEFMIPLVSSDHEITELLPVIHAAANKALTESGLTDFDTSTHPTAYHVTCMIETPRSCLRADAIAKSGIKGVSFGTNDLTSLVYGFSRDDCSHFLPEYLNKRLIGVDPFTSLDVRGVGSMIQASKNA